MLYQSPGQNGASFSDCMHLISNRRHLDVEKIEYVEIGVVFLISQVLLYPQNAYCKMALGKWEVDSRFCILAMHSLNIMLSCPRRTDKTEHSATAQCTPSHGLKSTCSCQKRFPGRALAITLSLCHDLRPSGQFNQCMSLAGQNLLVLHLLWEF